MGLLYGRAGRLSTKNAGFRPAQGGDEAAGLPELPLGCEYLGGNERDVLLAIRWVHGMSVICTECGLKTPLVCCRWGLGPQVRVLAHDLGPVEHDRVHVATGLQQIQTVVPTCNGAGRVRLQLDE